MGIMRGFILNKWTLVPSLVHNESDSKVNLRVKALRVLTMDYGREAMS